MKRDTVQTVAMMAFGIAVLMISIFSAQLFGGHPVEAARGADLNRRIWEETGTGAVDFEIDTGKADALIYEIRLNMGGEVNTGPLTVDIERAGGFTETWVNQNLGEGEDAGPIYDAQIGGLLFAGPRYLGPHETLHVQQPDNSTTYQLTVVTSQL